MEYEIWSEGYIATGESGGAVLHGVETAATFQKACNTLATKNGAFAKYYNATDLTYWGCKLFSSREKAQHSFG